MEHELFHSKFKSLVGRSSLLDIIRDSHLGENPHRGVAMGLIFDKAIDDCQERRDLKNAGDSDRKAQQHAATARDYREGEYCDGQVNIPMLFAGALSALNGGATSTRKQWPYAGTIMGVRPDGGHEGQGQQKCIDNMLQKGVTKGKEAVASNGDHEEIDVAQVNAAEVIQAAYRRHLKRINVVRTGIDENQARYWQLLRQRSTEMEWSKDSRYYLLFRVPLAYILVCLDAIKTFIESENKIVKKRLMTEDVRDLDDLMEALTKYKYDNVDCALYSWSNINPPENCASKRLCFRRHSPHLQHSTRNSL